MGFIVCVKATSRPQEVFGFRMDEVRYIRPHSNPNVCVTKYGDVLKQGNDVTHDIGIAVHLVNCCIRSWFTVIIVHKFQSLYCRRAEGASKKWYLSSSKFHLLVIKADRDDVANHNHKSSANELFYAESDKQKKR